MLTRLVFRSNCRVWRLLDFDEKVTAVVKPGEFSIKTPRAYITHIRCSNQVILLENFPKFDY